MPIKCNTPNSIKVGDYFESCTFHPCLCIEVDETGRNIEGISLVNGEIQNCSAVHCGVRLLNLKEAISWKLYGPEDAKEHVTEIWWNAET
jgi:hypothetical protein